MASAGEELPLKSIADFKRVQGDQRRKKWHINEDHHLFVKIDDDHNIITEITSVRSHTTSGGAGEEKEGSVPCLQQRNTSGSTTP